MKHQKPLRIVASGDRDIVMTRVFDAPRDLVFDAHTKTELIRRWMLGPDGWTMPVCEVDLRVGGRYRFVWKRESNGKEMGVGGSYRAIVRPDKLVHTELFDDAWYPGESEQTSTFVEKNGKTTLTVVMTYVSEEARDSVFSSGMESGLDVSYDRLQDLLATLG